MDVQGYLPRDEFLSILFSSSLSQWENISTMVMFQSKDITEH